MLAEIKTLLGINDTTKDSLINVLIQSAINEVLNYCHLDELPEELEATVIDVVIYKYNRLKTSGVDSEQYSGFSWQYSRDYPEAIMRQLRAYRKVRFI